MSGFSNLVDGGAECSGANPMKDLMKQFNRDTSLEQDRAITREDQLKPREAFHQAANQNPTSDEFIDAFVNENPPSQINDPFNMNEVASELQLIERPNHWTQEFLHHDQVPDFHQFDQVYQSALHTQRHIPQSHLVQDHFPHVPDQVFEDAFRQAEQINWIEEYQQKPVTADNKLKSGELKIDGDRVIADSSATAGSNWATEFEQRIDDYIDRSGLQTDPTAGTIWTEEYAKTIEKDWAEEFMEDEQNQHLERDLHSSEPLNDWLQEYEAKMKELNFPVDEEWEKMQKEWNQQSSMDHVQSIDPAYQEYLFQSNNPYLNASISEIDRSASSLDDLRNSILALEAKVQLQPEDAVSWYLLGLRQQENECEASAIAALRKSVALQPDALDAWIALAVSYTNENCRADAYDALENWLSKHPTYSSIQQAQSSGKDRLESLVNALLNTISLNPPDSFDPDVQISLGILFNISQEYDKAVDCFKTALSKRPNDYMLWNKLGATLANSSDPSNAIKAYFNALEINPTYIRVRYNLAISSIHLNQYREAAEHLLGALSLQKTNFPSSSNSDGTSSSLMSQNIWDTLRMTLYMLNRNDLVTSCDDQNLDAFRQHFDF